jgi:hypothetical protein
MIVDVIRPTNGPVRVRYLQAFCLDQVQRMRVVLAVRWGIPVSEVGRWRAELELDRQRQALGFSARHYEEVLMWQ